MSKEPVGDDLDETEDPGDDDAIGDRELEPEGDVDDVAFEVIDMVAHLGTNYALGYTIVDGEYSEDLEAHRWLGPGQGFVRVTDVDLLEQLAELSVLHDDDEPDDEDADPPEPPEPLTYAIVDTVAVDGVTWTLGRALAAPEGTEPDVYRYDGHGHSFSLANDVDADLRARIEDEVRGFEQDDLSYERIDFDLKQIVEYEGEIYALGWRYEDLEDDRRPPPTRVWRHLGEGAGFELVDASSAVHREVTTRFAVLPEEDPA